MKGLDEVTREFVHLFEAENIPYALMGGLAVRLHGLPRPTFDVDFTVLLPRKELPRFYQLVQELGYSVPAAQLSGWIDLVSGLPVIKIFVFLEGRSIDIDIFLAETRYQKEVLRRSQKHQVDTFEACFVSPEDLILLKLLAGRPKDLVDVGDVLFIQGTLEEAYLKQWATALGIAAELDNALRAKNHGN